MKSLLILFTLIAFTTVTCAGPTVYGKAEWVMSPGEFEKDWKKCSESIHPDVMLEAFNRSIEECLEKKGYVVRQPGSAASGKIGWKKNQHQFEKDRQECIGAIDENLNSEAFSQALDECLGRKGYTYQITQEVEKPKERSATTEKIKTAAITAGMVLVGVIAVTLYVGLMFLPRR